MTARSCWSIPRTCTRRRSFSYQTVLSRAIFERHKTLYGEKAKFDKVPPVLIALEEAQRVLTEAKGTIFALNRKGGT